MAPLFMEFLGLNLISNLGVTSILVGALVSIVDTLFPNKFSTILEVDYDTPYRYFVGNDAHLIGAPITNCQQTTVSQTSKWPLFQSALGPELM